MGLFVKVHLCGEKKSMEISMLMISIKVLFLFVEMFVNSITFMEE